GRHEEAVPFRTAKTDVRARFRKTDHADALARGGDDLNAGSRAGPDVPLDVAANAVGGRWGAGSWNIELNEALAVAKRLAVDVVDPDVSWHPGVSHVELLVVWR